MSHGFHPSLANSQTAERTFWEKATAMHVFCRQQRPRGDRLSVIGMTSFVWTRPDTPARRSPTARFLSVARHKAAFFREKDAGARWIDYSAAVSGGMQLVPEGFARDALQEDYERMVSGGMLADAEPFDLLIDGCADLEARANDV